MYDKFVEQMKMHTSLLQFLCDQYIIGDDIEYDKYLQRIEIIDNISANEEVNRTMDAISWTDMSETWRLAAHAHRNNSLTEMHDYKFTEMFWRYLFINKENYKLRTSLYSKLQECYDWWLTILSYSSKKDNRSLWEWLRVYIRRKMKRYSFSQPMDLKSC